MVPDACMVSELPLDAHAHILPRAGTVNSVLPATLVSLGVGLIQSSLIHIHIPTQMGVKERKTDAELCLCPNFCSIGPLETWAIY